MNENCLVTEDIVKVIPEKVDDNDIMLFKFYLEINIYFDEDGLQTLVNSLKTKKTQCTCPTCESIISGTVASCSICKKWFHATCEGTTKEELD